MDKNFHMQHFAEFCYYESKSGGPDPQIPTVAEMSKDVGLQEKIWRAGLYIAVYNVPFAEILWQCWPLERMQKEKEGLLDWLKVRFNRIVTRNERKTVRRTEWMNEYIQSYYKWMTEKLPLLEKETASMSPEERYIKYWEESISEIKRYGRYVALKLLESYNLFCGIKLEAPDIRPIDGWSPMRTVSWLFPEKEELLLSNDNNRVEEVNVVVKDLQNKLAGDFNVKMDLFHLQVALCEYRESYQGKRQYPGRSLDSMLGYYQKSQGFWDNNSDVLRARSAIFPHKHLGEKSVWLKPRNELGSVISEYGYTWSDLVYDYEKTPILGIPTEREDRICMPERR